MSLISVQSYNKLLTKFARLETISNLSMEALHKKREISMRKKA